MRLIMDGSLRLFNLSEEKKVILTKYLSLKNPTYDVMVRHKNTKALYAVKEYIKYYRIDPATGGLITGRGVWPMAMKVCGEDGINTTYNFSHEMMTTPLKKDVFELRDYQKGSIETILKNTQGIIQLDTGWGKTLCALKLAEETQLKTLIICHRVSILEQFVGDLKNKYGYEAGIINGKKFEIKDITIATIQTLKQRDLSTIKSSFGMVIFDECHTTISDKGIKVITSFNPYRLYGMTATPDRSDGQGEAVKFYFGDVIIKRDLPQETPTVEVVKFKGEHWGDDYPAIIQAQTENEERNQLIIDLVKREVDSGRRILVLTKRVAHYEKLFEMLSSYRCHMIQSGLNAGDQLKQNELLDRLRTGNTEFDVILGTFSMLSTGVNIPALDTLIIAGDLKSSVLSKQATGRILRIFDDKKTPKIIDIDDTSSGILHHQAQNRRRFYKENNFIFV